MGKSFVRGLAPHHDAVAVAGVREALELLASRTFSVIVCDLIMPEASGVDLYEALLKKDPALAARTLFCSGGAFTERAAAFVEAHPDRCLEKPIDMQQLARLVEKLGAAAPPERA